MRMDAVFGAIGRFAVRFRWLLLVAWIAGAFAAVSLLPSMNSVIQNNNTKFLPASAPSTHAATLAAPFGIANLQPIPWVAARTSAPLDGTDVAALSRLQNQLLRVPTVTRIRDLGRSADGHAEQYVVLAQFARGNQNGYATLVDALRAKMAHAGLPAGLQVHLAGAVAVQVDQQKSSGSTDSQLQALTAVFIIVLLVLIFRSLSLALLTLAPAFAAIIISGPLVGLAGQHGLKVSPIAAILLIVLVLGAGTDYGLFLVFRTREELRRGLTSSDAIVRALTKVGESITFSAATVIAALISLLAATFPFYSELGIPLAIGIGVTLLAGLTLLPGLLSIRLTVIQVKQRLFTRFFGRGKLIPWSIQGSGTGGVWGRVAGRIVSHPGPTLLAGLVVFGALAAGITGYKSGGFGGNTTPPSGSDSAKGTALLNRYFPQSSANPTNIIFKLKTPAWQDPAVLATAAAKLRAGGLFTQISGPLDPVGVQLTPAQFTELHAALGPAKALPAIPPASSRIPAAGYDIYRATANYVSPDGLTVQYQTGLKAGDPGSTQAMNKVPSIRALTTSVARSIGAVDSAVGGEAPALYDISSTSNSDLVHVIPIAIVVIGFLLALVMRSLVAPLYLIASVAISYLAALGLSVLVFLEIGGQSGLVFFLAFLMFIFLLALGEDYNILVMTRIREEARRYPLREAVTRAVSATGTTVTSAGLVLAGSFGVLAIVVGRSPGNGDIVAVGVGLAMGILMDTFLVRTLLVPSTVVLLGRWNWWPSRMSRAHEHPAVPATTVISANGQAPDEQTERMKAGDPPA